MTEGEQPPELRGLKLAKLGLDIARGCAAGASSGVI